MIHIVHIKLYGMIHYDTICSLKLLLQ